MYLYIYKEPFSFWKIISCLLVILGVALIEYKYSKLSMGRSYISKGFLFLILARLFWALGFLFVPFIQSLGVLLFSLILEGMVFVVSCACYLLGKQRIPLVKWRMKEKMPIIWVIGILSIFVQIALNVSLVNIPIIILAFLNLISPLVALLFFRFYLKESVLTVFN